MPLSTSCWDVVMKRAVMFQSCGSRRNFNRHSIGNPALPPSLHNTDGWPAATRWRRGRINFFNIVSVMQAPLLPLVVRSSSFWGAISLCCGRLMWLFRSYRCHQMMMWRSIIARSDASNRIICSAIIYAPWWRWSHSNILWARLRWRQCSWYSVVSDGKILCA